jgi:hypothetical protein
MLGIYNYGEDVDIVVNCKELGNIQSEPKTDYHLNYKIKSKLYVTTFTSFKM